MKSSGRPLSPPILLASLIRPSAIVHHPANGADMGKGIVVTWLFPAIFSLTYFSIGMYTLSAAPDYFTRCDEDPVPTICSRCAPPRPHRSVPLHCLKRACWRQTLDGPRRFSSPPSWRLLAWSSSCCPLCACC